jgi:hypothetical protein
MRTIRYSTKRIGTVVLGLTFYSLSIVQCASQTSDSVSVPRAAWERLESAIQGVPDAHSREARSEETSAVYQNPDFPCVRAINPTVTDFACVAAIARRN